MAGLQRMCKMFGGMKINGTMWLWDYVNDVAVKESEMPFGSERRAASDKAKYTMIAKHPTPNSTEQNP